MNIYTLWMRYIISLEVIITSLLTVEELRKEIYLFTANEENYNHGCQAGSILQRLSAELAAATMVLTLVSSPSKVERPVNLCVMAVTDLVTRLMMTSRSRFSVCVPSAPVTTGVTLGTASTFFLFHAIISSRKMARKMA